MRELGLEKSKTIKAIHKMIRMGFGNEAVGRLAVK